MDKIHLFDIDIPGNFKNNYKEKSHIKKAKLLHLEKKYVYLIPNFVSLVWAFAMI